MTLNEVPLFCVVNVSVLVDVVFVLDHERLFHDLQRQLPQSTQIVPLRKSGGVSWNFDIVECKCYIEFCTSGR